MIILFEEIVVINNTTLAGIPCLHIKPLFETKDLPTVFLYHGWSSKKENYEFMGKIIALHGFQVMVPDALNHGERGLLDYADLKIMEKNFWEIVINSVEEFTLLLKEAKRDLGVEPSKIAVMGHSMGGIIASGVFARDKRIKTLITMNGACAWEDVEERIRVSRGVDRAASISIEKLRTYDPLQLKENFYPRPVLLQHGENDQSVPIESQICFYDQLVIDYQDHPKKLRFSVIKNLNHHKTIGMLEEAIAWLKQYI